MSNTDDDSTVVSDNEGTDSLNKEQIESLLHDIEEQVEETPTKRKRKLDTPTKQNIYPSIDILSSPATSTRSKSNSSKRNLSQTVTNATGMTNAVASNKANQGRRKKINVVPDDTTKVTKEAVKIDRQRQLKLLKEVMELRENLKEDSDNLEIQGKLKDVERKHIQGYFQLKVRDQHPVKSYVWVKGYFQEIKLTEVGEEFLKNSKYIRSIICTRLIMTYICCFLI